MKRSILFLTLCIILFGCQKKIGPKPRRLRVAATIAPHAYFTTRIGTENLEVISILSPSVDIHTYEPTPQSMENLKNIDLWIQVGATFEEKMTPILMELNPDLTILNINEKIPLLPVTSDTDFLTSCSHNHGDRDMHTWMSPRQAQNTSRIIAQSLVKLDKAHSHEFSAGLNQFLNELADLDRHLTLQLKDLIGGAILVAHPSLGYFCNDYQLKQFSIECEGKEPLPQDLQNLEEHLKDERAICVFSQKGFDARGPRLLANRLSLPLYELDPFAWDYLANIKKIGNQLSDAAD
ncbi:MAG: zinc ABC transporter substrate-binding protein [Candidatus Algichlamydia australiensis]|nr:zinc ABC transporter substrate-binding protein [Chlamydiales bacterium]